MHDVYACLHDLYISMYDAYVNILKESICDHLFSKIDTRTAGEKNVSLVNKNMKTKESMEAVIAHLQVCMRGLCVHALYVYA